MINTYLDMKKLIRLTESDLHKIVKETVDKILSEHDMLAMGRGIGRLNKKEEAARNAGVRNLNNGGQYADTEASFQRSKAYGDKAIKLKGAAEKALGQNPSNNDDYHAGWNDVYYGKR
jgi:hypothetical protein